MRKSKLFILLQLSIIMLYFINLFLPFIIPSFNLILTIICLLFIPGYNLIEILKPNSDIIEKIGFSLFLGLAIDNFTMFFYYIFSYDFLTTSEDVSFFYNWTILFIIIQIISISLIFLNYIKQRQKNQNIDDGEINKTAFFEQIKDLISQKFQNINLKVLVITICFYLSLAFLLIITITNSYGEKSFWTAFDSYRNFFMFFYRVPLLFFIFLILVISFLFLLILKSDNVYLSLLSISIFFYVLWILPYLQINNHFSSDVYILSIIIDNYDIYGILANKGHCLILYINYDFGHRYSTSFFTGLLLKKSTHLGTKFSLWFLYPLIYIFIPFYFYSVFKNFKRKNNKQLDKKTLIVLVLLILVTPQFIKFAHSATTGVIGIILFFMIIVEFFKLASNQPFKLDYKNTSLIIFLFIFLSLTHTEECLYIFLIFIIYTLYDFSVELYKKKKQNNLTSKFKEKKYYQLGILIFILIFLFYLTQEFFGWILLYLELVFGENSPMIDTLSNLYDNSLIILPILGGNYTINIFITLLILLALFSYLSIFFVFSKKNYYFIKFVNKLKIYFEKVLEVVKNVISKKITQIIFFPLIIFLIIFGNILYGYFLTKEGINLIIEIILSTSILIFHIFLFIRGISYYKIGKAKQNYFFLAILCSAIIMIIFFVVGNFLLTLYIFNYRFFSFFVFFNLIIIQNNYFSDLFKEKKIRLLLITFVLLIIGTFYSLSKLAYS